MHHRLLTSTSLIRYTFASRSRRALTAELAASPETALASLSRRIGRLSQPQQATLRSLCQHLHLIAQHESRNKMGVANLAVIFTSVIFGDDDAAALEAAMHGSKVGPFGHESLFGSRIDILMSFCRITSWRL